jgi:hypothetical protein
MTEFNKAELVRAIHESPHKNRYGRFMNRPYAN